MQQQYKYQLFKGSKKWVCPQCGRKTFVPFVLADNKTLAGPEFGRCDREQKCGYFRAPGGNTRQTAQPARQVEPAPPIRFSPSVLRPKVSTLYRWAESVLGRDKAVEAWRRYNVSADSQGRTIFWQQSIDGTVRAGKAMAYDSTGHRLHEVSGAVTWCHRLAEFAPQRSGSELEQCFFGEHLLPGNRLPVAVVESEKTAVMMSALEPEVLWLACGGSQMLKSDTRLHVLSGFNVVLVPDEGQTDAWARIAAQHGYQLDDICREFPTAPGCDILDLYLQPIKK